MGKMIAGILGSLMLTISAGMVQGQTVVAALGDSLTQGYGLPVDEGFVPQLQDWLDAEGADVRLINAGVSGDTSSGGLARVAWTLTPDVQAVIVTLGGNDFLRGIDPELTRANITKIVETAQDAGVAVLLIGMQAPGNFGPEYKARFDAIYPQIAEAFDTIYLNSFFAGLGDGTPAQLQRFFQADGLHPTAEGVGRIVSAVGPKVQELVRQVAD